MSPRPSGGPALYLLAVAVCAALLLSPLVISSVRASTVTPITKSWLDQQVVAWKPAQNTTVGFAALDVRASYGGLETSYNSWDVQTADLGMLLSADASCVRVDVNYAPWLLNQQTYINKMDAVIGSIRAQGQCVIIADAASQSYRGGGQLTWSQFKAAWVQRVQTLAARYHPDFYIVVKEPGWYVQFVSDASTNPQFQNATDWLALTQKLAQAVHAASPSTRVGVAVSSDALAAQFYIQYVNGLYGVADVQFAGYDLYTASGFQNIQWFLSTYGNGGKPVWIAEAWSGTADVAFNSSRAALDKEWMLVLYYFAQQIHAQLVMPFFTDVFASYGPYPTKSTALDSMYQTQRTPVFYEYLSIARSYGIGVR
jgi:hypothetical protein